MRRVTASKLELFDHCVAAITLQWVDAPSKPAERGSALHRFVLLDVPRVGREAALELVPAAYQDEAAEIPIDEIGVSDPAQFATEVTLSLNVTTGDVREIGRGSAARDYHDVRDGEIAGTLDAAALAGGDLVAPDVKCGHADKTDPRTSL